MARKKKVNINGCSNCLGTGKGCIWIIMKTPLLLKEETQLMKR